MSTYITRTKGLIGSSVLQKQECLVKAAYRQGIQPLSLYYYPADEESLGELSARQDGILSGVSLDDDIIVQLPTMLGKRYEQVLLNKLASFRQNSTSKLIIVVSVLPDQVKREDIINDIQLYNKADVLIVPSVEAGTFLREHGLSVTRLVYLNIWDWNINLSFNQPIFKRHVVTLDKSLAKQVSGKWVRSTSTVIYDLHMAGGYVLLWPTARYDSDIVSEEILASGLPVLVNKNSYLARLVQRAGMGVAFDDLAAIDTYVAHSSQSDYQMYAANAGRFSAFLREGGFTSYAISQALAQANQLKWGKEN